MRILVTADVHLAEGHPERKEALDAVLEVAERESVDCVLIAGDLFDAGVDVDAIKGALRSRFTDTPFHTYAIPGNHDAAAFRAEEHFGDDFTLLDDGPVERVDLGGATLLAVPFVDAAFADLVEPIREAAGDGPNVLMLHGTLSSTTGAVFGEESRYLPFTPEELLDTGVEYVVAGHIHATATQRSFGDGACVFAYPGSPASITRSETGPRGVWVLDLAEASLHLHELETHHYVRERLSLHPGGAEDALDALARRLDGRALDHATLVVEPEGFIEMDEAAFFEALDHIVSAAGARGVEVDRSAVQSARTVLQSDLYRGFDEALEAREDVDHEAIRRIALRALSMEERS